MNLEQLLLAAWADYGLPALFGVTLVSALGLPLPATILLITIGSLLERGDLALPGVVAAAGGGAVLGDQTGYALARWGGRSLALRFSRRLGREQSLHQAEALMAQWGDLSIFFTRWLITPLCPWLNLSSGITAHPYPRFFFWSALGEMLWVLWCLAAGWLFRSSLELLLALIGSVTWSLLALLAAALAAGWAFHRYRRRGQAA